MFACPYCFTPLTGVELRCDKCNYQGWIKDGRYHLHRTDNTWEECQAQVRATHKAAMSTQPLPVPTPEEIECLKHVGDVNQILITKSKELLGDIQGKIFLDLGGHTGWSANAFVERGAMGFILDIDELGMPKSTKLLVSIVGDGYYLPFIDGYFDFVFDTASLHHFVDKEKVLTQMKRVLKPGGMYVSQGNPPNPHPTDDARQVYWDKYGLIEIFATKEEYEADFKKVFNNFEFHYPVANGNSIMVARKEAV